MPKVTFILRDGSQRVIDAKVGDSLLDLARDHDLDVEGTCEGSMACATCHVIVDQPWYAKLSPPCEEEQDMLDLAYGLTRTLRLGCQIVMSEELDGLTVTLGPED